MNKLVGSCVSTFLRQETVRESTIEFMHSICERPI